MSALVVPIFPLPEVTFFPHTMLPLHVFEARYRALVTDALGRDRRLVVVQLRPGWQDDYAGRPPVAPVAGVGEIVGCERLATGRYNIALKGLARVRIVRELPADTLYRLVEGVELDDVEPSEDVSGTVARIRASCERLLRVLDRPETLLADVLGTDPSPAVLGDRVASAILPDPALRQELLETVDVARRLTRLSQALEELVRQVPGGE